AIVVNGIEYDIGVRVHRWDERTGFNGYKTPRRFSRRKGAERPIDAITQFVDHHSAADRKNPSVMFDVLWNQRKLSVHFALEDNGEIWQFVDVIEKTWHAKGHNSMSIGVECCHYPSAFENPGYYSEKRRERTGNLPHEIVRQPAGGGRTRNVFAFTEEAVDSLARLTAGCWLAVGQQRSEGFNCEYDSSPEFPREDFSIPFTAVKNPKGHIGAIAHRHCTSNKWDPAGLDFAAVEALTKDYYDGFRAAI
ncbi:MAG: N-acetylmuramoyl-L-alanine amidase, partial [Desulfobacteraceae bacterium]|nr:N-acetylmuramoyl-L-alanine amidase [Desulfobacteraceae bacterium]